MFSSLNINTLNVSRSWSLALKSSPLAGQSCQIKRQSFRPDFKICPKIVAKLCVQIFLVVRYLATLAQVYYKLDNGSNVCGLEFNFTRRNTFVKGDTNSVRSDLGDDVSYDKQILQKFSHGFEVESEEGRSVNHFHSKSKYFVSLSFTLLSKWVGNRCLALVLNLARWVDPEFKDEEDEIREVEAGTATEEEVAVELDDNGKVVNNMREEEEDIVVDVEMEELQPLKTKQ